MQQGAELRGGGEAEMFEQQADVGSSVADQDPPLSDQYYIYFNTKIKTLTDTPVQKLIISLALIRHVKFFVVVSLKEMI